MNLFHIIPCPICGNDPVVYRRGKMWYAACVNKACEHPRTRWDKHRLNVIARWNRAAQIVELEKKMSRGIDNAE